MTKMKRWQLQLLGTFPPEIFLGPERRFLGKVLVPVLGDVLVPVLRNFSGLALGDDLSLVTVLGEVLVPVPDGISGPVLGDVLVIVLGDVSVPCLTPTCFTPYCCGLRSWARALITFELGNRRDL